MFDPCEMNLIYSTTSKQKLETPNDRWSRWNAIDVNSIDAKENGFEGFLPVIRDTYSTSYSKTINIFRMY